jgi:poly(hydroxyalkanoate) granule-associated protein
MTQTTRKDARSQTMRESVEQVWLAGLGALALTEEEGSKFFRSLVKKGEGVERRSRARLDGAVTAAKRAPATAMTKLEQRTDDLVENVMHRLGVPTRREITGLTRRIEGLASSMERKPRARRVTSASRASADTSVSSTPPSLS